MYVVVFSDLLLDFLLCSFLLASPLKQHMKIVHGGVLYFCDSEEHLLCNASSISDYNDYIYEDKYMDEYENKVCENVNAKC